MNPVKKYEQDIKEHGFQRDPAQEQAVKSLDELFHQFQDYMNTPCLLYTSPSPRDP